MSRSSKACARHMLVLRWGWCRCFVNRNYAVTWVQITSCPVQGTRKCKFIWGVVANAKAHNSWHVRNKYFCHFATFPPGICMVIRENSSILLFYRGKCGIHFFPEKRLFPLYKLFPAKTICHFPSPAFRLRHIIMTDFVKPLVDNVDSNLWQPWSNNFNAVLFWNFLWCPSLHYV